MLVGTVYFARMFSICKYFLSGPRNLLVLNVFAHVHFHVRFPLVRFLLVVVDPAFLCFALDLSFSLLGVSMAICFPVVLHHIV